VVTIQGGRRPAAALLVGLAWAVAISAGAAEPPRDVDAWHRALEAAVGVELTDEPADGWTLGLYPTAGVAVGPSNWASYQLHGALSLSRAGRLSLFAGYGYERGPTSRSHMVTLGWGGVQRLQAGRSQRGFYGKFLRYRRMDDFDHGLHHGLSVGHESGAGILALSIEAGAARSSANHWSVIGQISLKLAFPVAVALSRTPDTQPPP
jgi:hypothetical protein